MVAVGTGPEESMSMRGIPLFRFLSVDVDVVFDAKMPVKMTLLMHLGTILSACLSDPPEPGKGHRAPQRL